MSELGSFEAYGPGEGSGVTEKASESAREQFQESQKQARKQARDEKKARKRDDRVAAAIRQFLSEEKFSHLYQTVSKLVAKDCPSLFVLAILSLIHEPSLAAVEEFMSEHGIRVDLTDATSVASAPSVLSEKDRTAIIEWTTRMELVIEFDAEHILPKLMVDESTMDGVVLQLVTFMLVEFFEERGMQASYEALQPLTAEILQNIIEPHLETIERHFEEIRLAKKAEEGGNDDDD